MKLEQGIKVHNKFDVKVYDQNGKLKQESTAYNIVLNGIYNRLCTWMPFFQGIAFGTGTGELAATRTTLFNYLGWKQMGQIDCGTVQERRQLPIMHRKRKITLAPEEFVDQTITEVGVAFSSSTGTSGDGNTTYSGLVTHALLDTPIAKVALDVVVIEATIYFDFSSEMFDGSIKWKRDSNLIDYLFGADMQTCSFRVGSWPSYFPNIGTAGSVSRTQWIADIPNKKVSTPVVRFGISQGNGDLKCLTFGQTDLKGIFHAKPPIPTVFNEYNVTNEILGVGDGVNKNFNFSKNDIIPGTEQIYKNDVLVNSSEYSFEKDRILRFFDRLVFPTALSGVGYGVAFSPDGDYIVAVHVGGNCITAYQNSTNIPSQPHNIVFNTPPAVGEVISSNYKIGWIPKDANHVLDVSLSIIWNP